MDNYYTSPALFRDLPVVTKQRQPKAAQGGVEEVRKPLVIEQYNLFMDGVDNGVQLLSYYGYSHRTLKRILSFSRCGNSKCVHNVPFYSMLWKTSHPQGVQSPAGKRATNGDNSTCG